MNSLRYGTKKNAKKISGSIIVSLSNNAAAVFPLLCPVREYEWIRGWNCDMIFSDSGYAEEFCVFTTHFADSREETWICTRYEPNNRIQYTKFSDIKVTRLDIQLISENKNSSEWQWSETYVSLRPNDKEALMYSEDDIVQRLKRINRDLEYFLVNREML
ncbi:MAG: hypothetical protein LWX56_10605 [Ignavibacteria bacterium]|nr:hypothetical protein [Ignavibacteria bacterium]